MIEDGSPFQHRFTPMVAMGRKFELGDLYDYRTDRILPDDARMFWRPTSLAWPDCCFMPEINWMPSKDTEFTSNSKTQAMFLDNHMTASVVAGLMEEYNGASNFINDQPDPGEVTLTYVWTGKSFEKRHANLQFLIDQNVAKLSQLTQTGTQQPTPEATHVVVSVFYGAQIYCVFAQDLNGKEDDEDANAEVQENLSKILDKFHVAFHQKKDVDKFKEEFTKQKKHQISRLKCRLYSDLQAESVRHCNLFDAYSSCIELKNKLVYFGKKGSKCVPIAIQLLPLNALFSNAPGRNMFNDYYDVGQNLVNRCLVLFGDLKRIVIKAEKFCTAGNNEDHCSTLREFVRLISKYQQFLKSKLKEAVVKARSSYSNDSDVEMIVKKAESHPYFKPFQLNCWLSFKQSELDMTESIVSGTREMVAIFSDTNQMERQFATSPQQLSSATKKYALVLTVPRLDELCNVNLDAMKQCADNTTNAFGQFVGDVGERINRQPWHTNQRKQKLVLDYIRDLTVHAERNQEVSNQVQFAVTFGESSKLFGCSYSIYEDGKLLKNKLRRLPDPPTGLRICLPSTNQPKKAKKDLSSIEIKWDYEELHYPCLYFLIEYRLKGSADPWTQQRTNKPDETQLSVTFPTGTAMEVRVAAETCIGRSNFSDVLDTDPTIENVSVSSTRASSKVILQPPTNLRAKSITGSSIALEWTPPPGDLRGLRYRIMFLRKGGDSSCPCQMDNGFDWTGFNFEGLSSETTYLFNMVTYTHYDLADSELSETAEFTTTKKMRFAETFVNKCEKIDCENGYDLYQVPVTKVTKKLSIAEHYAFDAISETIDRHHEMGDVKILLVGASGSGKTSLINSMINKIFDVVVEDPFRFQLIDQTQEGNQTKINLYEICLPNEFYLGGVLTIIDVPSYVDNDSVKNKEITEMIRKFVNDKDGVHSMNIIGFVMDSSVPHVTALQFYIFASLISIFGSGVQENIHFLLNNAENENKSFWKSVVDSTLVNHGPFYCYQNNFHKFNSLVYSPLVKREAGSVDTEDFHRWLNSFNDYFIGLEDLGAKVVSQSKQISDERKRLEATVNGIGDRTKIAVSKLEELKRAQKELEENMWLVDANNDVKFRLDRNVWCKVRLPLGEYSTNCNKCKITCHSCCGIKHPKENCAVMDHSMPEESRSCRVCQCAFNEHSSQSFKWVCRLTNQNISMNFIKKRYESELKKTLTSQQLMELLKKDVETKKKDVTELIKEILSFTQRINKISKHQDRHVYLQSTSVIDYIIQVISDFIHAEREKRGRRFMNEEIQEWSELGRLAYNTKHGDATYYHISSFTRDFLDLGEESDDSSDDNCAFRFW